MVPRARARGASRRTEMLPRPDSTWTRKRSDREERARQLAQGEAALGAQLAHPASQSGKKGVAGPRYVHYSAAYLSIQDTILLDARDGGRIAWAFMETHRDRRCGPGPLRDPSRRATSTGSSRSSRPVARLVMDVQEDRPLRPGYPLKTQQLRPGGGHRAGRRHPAPALRASRGARARGHAAARTGSSARAPTSTCWAPPPTPSRSTSASTRTRRGSPSRTPRSTPGLKSLAAVNGACAGGGYELALACDEILLVDDASSAVSLPEVSLLGGAAGDGRPHPGHGQAQGAARPRRRLLQPGRRRQGQARRRSGDWWTRRCPCRASRRACPRRPGPSRRARPEKTGPGRGARAPRRVVLATKASSTGTSASRWTPRRGWRRSRCAPPKPTSRGPPPPCASGAASCGRCAPSASWTTCSSTCASTGPRSGVVVLQTQGRRRRASSPPTRALEEDAEGLVRRTRCGTT